MESKENSSLSARQQLVLPHLLLSPSYEEAARRAEISTKQIHAWLKQPAFLEALKKHRAAIFSNALAALKTSTHKAVQTLILLLDDEDPRIRLLASEKLLSLSIKSIELLEFEERIAALEEVTQQAAQKQPFSGKP